jgi:hypothetical protein
LDKKIPSWWIAYNKLKHDRLNNYELATYENVISAMSALHQVLCRDYNFIPTTLLFGWLDSNNEDVMQLLATTTTSAIITGGLLIPVNSKLFVTPFRDNFVIEEAKGYSFNPECDFSNKMKDRIFLEELP